MKLFHNKFVSITSFVAISLFLINPALGQEKKVKAELPVLVVSCGQSPGPLKIKVFMKRLDINFDYNLQADADYLTKKKAAGKPFKSIIIVTGASLKGMGAAGVSVKDELSRTKELIAEAKKQKITIIGAHLEGMARRAKGAMAGDNSDELTIDEVCPVSDLLVVRSDGNEDGRFTAIAKEKNIPLIEFAKNMELGNVLKGIFSK
jgi:hypothetical protein